MIAHGTDSVLDDLKGTSLCAVRSMSVARSGNSVTNGSSASDIEARSHQRELDGLICERLAKDQDMENRLRLVEEQLHLSSTAARSHRASIGSDVTADSDKLTITHGDTRGSTAGRPTNVTSGLHSEGIAQRDFETLLEDSSVYRRNVHRDENTSFRSSVLRPSAWSGLSGLSLADVSVLSVIALPIRSEELPSDSWFTAATSEGPQRSANVAVLSSTTDDFPTSMVMQGLADGFHRPVREAEGPVSMDTVHDEALPQAQTGPAANNVSNRDNSAVSIDDESQLWIPQARPDGCLSYFSSLAGLSRTELPLEKPTSANETAPPLESGSSSVGEDAALAWPQPNFEPHVSSALTGEPDPKDESSDVTFSYAPYTDKGEHEELIESAQTIESEQGDLGLLNGALSGQQRIRNTVRYKAYSREAMSNDCRGCGKVSHYAWYY